MRADDLRHGRDGLLLPGVDLVLDSPGASDTNLGIGAFFESDVMFDATQGVLGIRVPQMGR